MKTFQVSYKLAGAFLRYLIDANNEFEAIQKVLSSVYCESIFHDFKIERYREEWN